MKNLFILLIIGLSAFSLAEHTSGGGTAGSGSDHSELNWGAPYIPCPASNDAVSNDQMKLLVPMLATRVNRLKHVLWHYGSGGLDSQMKTEIDKAFGPGWSSPNPECPAPKADSAADDYNAVGENFLYMHRAMRNAVNEVLRGKEQKCIGGWTEIPSKETRGWPVPGGTSRSGAKSDAALEFMQEWYKMMRNPVWLKKHSLSQLGQLIESTIHNNMHMRWADDQKGNIDTNFPFNKKFLTDDKFPPRWKADAESNDYLGNPYSAHVNPHFWKLHGLVDDMIDHWAKANGYKELSVDCGKGEKKRKGCYQWSGTWDGGKFETTEARGTATLSFNGSSDRNLESNPAVQKLAKEKLMFKHVFDKNIEREFKAAPPKANRALRFETTSDPATTAEQEYEANKDRWAQMEKQWLARLCP